MARRTEGIASILRDGWAGDKPNTRRQCASPLNRKK